MIVSIGIIAYNEENTLPLLLEDIVSQDYPASGTEVILADSMSTDRTHQVMTDFQANHPEYLRCVITNNTRGNQASGWNTVIREVGGDVLVRVDAHARIEADFISKNVECLESGEMVSGGPRPSIAETDSAWQKTLLLAESSMFGSGISDFRRESGRKYVKSLFHGAYRKEVIDKVGFFNESLGRTEDNEYHYRIRKAGYKICYDPQIRSYQNVRGSLRKMVKQKYGNGYWVALTLKECPKCLSIYYFVPFAFVVAILITTMLEIAGFPLLGILMWGLYWGLAVIMAIMAVIHKPKNLYELLLPFLFFVLHLSYGIGSVVGMLKLPFWKPKKSIGSEGKYGR